MPIITLLTDFGLSDPFVGLMKGAILETAPGARIVDLTHDVPPQDVLAGAMVLETVLGVFPRRTIHTAVVDPGVGSSRRGIAIETDNYLWVGPDNGIFTAVLCRDRLCQAIELSDSAYHRSTVSATFHGRDVFAPVAAHLANGTPIDRLGKPIDDLVTLDLCQPVHSPQGLELAVVWIDRFGNLITNLTTPDFEQWHKPAPDQEPVIEVAGRIITGVRQTFSDADRDELVAYFGSTGRLEIALRDGNAAAHLGVKRGAVVGVS